MNARLPSRRSFLGRALVLPAGLALGGPAKASAESHLRELLRRYMAVTFRIRERNGAWGAPPHLHAAQEADRRIREDLMAQIEAEPITSMEDLAVVLFVVAHIPGEKWQLSERCWAFVADENLQ